jgi:hypothetical protein
MRESAQTISHAGVQPLTVLANGERQDGLERAIVDFALTVPKGQKSKWHEFAGTIITATLQQGILRAS